MKKSILIMTFSLSLLFNGFLFYKIFNENNTEAKTQEKLPYLSKRIFVENQNDILINFIPLRQNLKEYIEKQSGRVGAYFEYLPSGISIGVNDRKEVAMASLSKIPVAMEIFKKIEQKKISLADVLTIETRHLDKRFGNLWKQGEGTKISIGDLVKLSLTESDNTATNVLLGKLKDEELNEVYKSLDITITINPKDKIGYLLVSPKNYSSIFRSLYLSSFLSKENSNYILDILTQTIFKDKIPAGVPNNVTVAHKVGIFEELSTSQSVYIDCGIIYIPNRPYILCAFVQDTDEKAKKHISHISEMIYKYISEVKGGN